MQSRAQLHAVTILGQLDLDANHDDIIVRTCDAMRYDDRGVWVYRSCS